MKLKIIFALVMTLTLSACSSWVFRIDVAQGNYLIQQDIDKLRIGMTKEQVLYVLGKPVIRDSFADDTFYYVYKMKRGKNDGQPDYRKDLFLQFEENKLTSMTGDFDQPEDFNTPLDI